MLRPFSKDEKERALSREEARVLCVCRDPEAGLVAESGALQRPGRAGRTGCRPW